MTIFVTGSLVGLEQVQIPRLAAAVEVNPNICAWFAFLHDSQRHNDGFDPAHGSRAADFALRLRRQGVIDELSGPEFEYLCEAMRLHSDGHTVAEPAIRACWDSDRLDLGRVGIRPEPSRLCTDAARERSIIDEAFRMSSGRGRQLGAGFAKRRGAKALEQACA